MTEKVHAWAAWPMHHWKERVIPWLMDEGEAWFSTALDYEESSYERLELIRKMGGIWSRIFWENPWEKNGFALLIVSQLALNNLMRDIYEIIERGIARDNFRELLDAGIKDESFADFVISLTPDNEEWYLIDHPDMEDNNDVHG